MYLIDKRPHGRSEWTVNRGVDLSLVRADKDVSQRFSRKLPKQMRDDARIPGGSVGYLTALEGY
jgi:hypothetical protein